MKWEYLVLNNRGPIKDTLDRAGDDGWELVHFEMDEGYWRVIFKRHKKP